MDPTPDVESNIQRLFANVIRIITVILTKDVDQSVWSVVTVQCTKLAFETNVKILVQELVELEPFAQFLIIFLYVVVLKDFQVTLLEYVNPYQ